MDARTTKAFLVIFAKADKPVCVRFTDQDHDIHTSRSAMIAIYDFSGWLPTQLGTDRNFMTLYRSKLALLVEVDRLHQANRHPMRLTALDGTTVNRL